MKGICDSTTIQASAVLNPNKSVLTIDRNGRILNLNKVACDLLGFEETTCHEQNFFDNVCNPSVVEVLQNHMNFKLSSSSNCSSFLRCFDASPDQNYYVNHEMYPLSTDVDVTEKGYTFSGGRVIGMWVKEGLEKYISIWMKRLNPEMENGLPQWIVVLEPAIVQETNVTVDEKGKVVMQHDEVFIFLFGEKALCDIFKYLKPVKLPTQDNDDTFPERQECTAFMTAKSPVSVTVSRATLNSDYSFDTKVPLYDFMIEVSHTASSVVVLTEEKNIAYHNPLFVEAHFGYKFNEISNNNIKILVPNFDSYWSTNQKHFDMKQDSVTDSQVEAVTTSRSTINCDSSTASPNNAFLATESQEMQSSNDSNFSRIDNLSSHRSSVYREEASNIFNSNSQSEGDFFVDDGSFCDDIAQEEGNSPSRFGLATSTPAVSKKRSQNVTSYCHHNEFQAHNDDGYEFPMIFSMRKVFFNDEYHYCLWFVMKKEFGGESYVASLFPPGHDSYSFLGFHAFHHNEDPKSTLEESDEENVPSGWDASSMPSKMLRLHLHSSDSSLKSRTDSSQSFVKSKNGRNIESQATEPESDEEDPTENTRTDGSSGDEYSVNKNKTSTLFRKPQTPIKRSLSEGDLRKPDSSSSISDEEPESVLVAGDYDDSYSIIKQMGKGAFGCVKLSYRKDDGLIVVTKFIKKSQVFKESWVTDPETKAKVPLEVHLLMKLQHPHIVRGLDYFENDDYFQLVMEKWGSGMDLFDFIERNPALDEPLTSYIFRQIVSPMRYLRSQNLLHRDIKDENLIINHKFRIKMIDFGSAAYINEDKLFNLFAGTVEYCSPEVLKGNKYRGPELEVWSLGITLYTLMYGENPFLTVEEVKNDVLTFPINYSECLTHLLTRMLDKNPNERITLEDVWTHQWTHLEINLDYYSFEDIVTCELSELNPFRYVSEYSDSELTMSMTSNSFLSNDRHQSLVTSGLKDRTSSTPLNDSCEKDLSLRRRDRHESSGTTYSSTSLQSTVTIDSAILTMDPMTRKRKRDLKASETESLKAEKKVDSRAENCPSSSNSLCGMTSESSVENCDIPSQTDNSEDDSSISSLSSGHDNLSRQSTLSNSSSSEDTLGTNYSLTLNKKPQQNCSNFGRHHRSEPRRRYCGASTVYYNKKEPEYGVPYVLYDDTSDDSHLSNSLALPNDNLKSSGRLENNDTIDTSSTDEDCEEDVSSPHLAPLTSFDGDSSFGPSSSAVTSFENRRSITSTDDPMSSVSSINSLPTLCLENSLSTVETEKKVQTNIDSYGQKFGNTSNSSVSTNKSFDFCDTQVLKGTPIAINMTKVLITSNGTQSNFWSDTEDINASLTEISSINNGSSISDFESNSNSICDAKILTPKTITPKAENKLDVSDSLNSQSTNVTFNIEGNKSSISDNFEMNESWFSNDDIITRKSNSYRQFIGSDKIKKILHVGNSEAARKSVINFPSEVTRNKFGYKESSL